VQQPKKDQKINFGVILNFNDLINGAEKIGKMNKIAIEKAKHKTPNNLSGIDLKISIKW
jgi:hypothetical protein